MTNPDAKPPAHGTPKVDVLEALLAELSEKQLLRLSRHCKQAREGSATSERNKVVIEFYRGKPRVIYHLCLEEL